MAKEAVHGYEEKTRKPEPVLAGRFAMVSVAETSAEEPAGVEAQGRPTYHQRHHPCVAVGLPPAGLSFGVWPFDYGI